MNDTEQEPGEEQVEYADRDGVGYSAVLKAAMKVSATCLEQAEVFLSHDEALPDVVKAADTFLIGEFARWGAVSDEQA